jgi:reverse transcriptase-like protein/integrase-like protein/chromodomain-containing protein
MGSPIVQGKTIQEEWKEFKKDMFCKPFAILGFVNGTTQANIMVDSGCLSYALCDPQFAKKNNLQRISTPPLGLESFNGSQTTEATEVAVLDIDLDGYSERIFAYITPLSGHDLFLGLPWIYKRDVTLQGCKKRLQIGQGGPIIRSKETQKSDLSQVDIPRLISAVSFQYLRRKKNNCQVFAVSVADINKALRKLEAQSLKPDFTKLPEQYRDFLPVFDRQEADKLPPLRGPGVDHSIELEKGVEPPWGPLYSMSKDELLVLRKTLSDYLEKGFIRVSNSPAAAPVLFVKKPGGGLRFCVDYRALNKLTKKDRYPLPLIQETLQSLAKAKWFTKLDVIAAFHRLRISQGDEWKTAFRTRYGLYEWLVTPFGLSNAPSTFQKYINWVLRDFLDDFCSAYIDDILIYSSGSLEDHRKKVKSVLVRLQEAGLQCDLDKCEFEVKSTKYLGFIIEAGKGIRMDPDKIKAIMEWGAPTTVRGVRGFLGFANFYRRFIQGYSEIVRPLTDLTKKDNPWRWTPSAEEAFQKLKRIFITEPALAQFDFDKTTRVEADSSGYCVGGTLLQANPDGLFIPCAFFSGKLTPAECNYEIYDKEMLAIIRCLEEWDSELQGVGEFEILSDHKNLEYFMTVRKLTERQIRWSLTLSRFNFKIRHIDGKDNVLADPLSRREQDLPADDQDSRLQGRYIQLLKPETIIRKGSPVATTTIAPMRPTTTPPVEHIPDAGHDGPLANWDQAIEEDTEYTTILRAIQEGNRRIPPELSLKLSIAECRIQGDRLTFRNRLWVPKGLRVQLIQDTHDSQIHVHPGREGLYAILARQYFWPGMGDNIRQFIRNCDSCAANKAWRTRRQGFLKPLPIPDRVWSEISMDFVIDLPESEGCTNMVVITDRLSKGVVAGGLKDITVDSLVKWFLHHYYPYHFLPTAIVSDRGSQFVSAFWKRLCDVLRILRRLSTAFSPETDGSTEKANDVIKTTLRELVEWSQDDWVDKLPIAISAINGRNATSTGVSPFFLAHGWEQTVFDFDLDGLQNAPSLSPVAKADQLLKKLRETRDFVQATMAAAQDTQEKQANAYRSQATVYQVGDKVWLSLENIKSNRRNKSLDHRYAKFTVLEVLSSHNYKLDTPPGIHNVFHTRLLRPANNDPLQGQAISEPQPFGLLIDNNLEYEVESILDQKKAPGRGNHQQYLIKWKGYTQPTWEPYSFVKDLAALDTWEASRGG